MITKNYTHLGLFEGIGGFSLAAHWMGWKTTAWCEWNPFGQHVLKSLFPEAEGFSDITKTDFTKYANRIDIITGGFPCQPFSTAGKRKGTDDARYLWPEMLRAIREIRPCWVVGENVYGLVNWDGGLVFDTVCADLENEGFEVWPVVLPAAGVNAPHRRDRIWFIAHFNSARLQKTGTEQSATGTSGTSAQRPAADTKGAGTGEDFGGVRGLSDGHSEGVQRWPSSNPHNKGTGDGYRQVQSADGEIPQRDNDAEPGDTDCKLNANPCGQGLQVLSCTEQPEIYRPDEPCQGCESCGISATPAGWDFWPTVPPLCSGDDGFSELLDADTVSEVAGKKVRNAFSWWRQESIKAGGNAIVPQVALQIFRTINEFEEGEALM